MRLRGMIFDLDGTLGDTVPVCIQAFQRTFYHYLGQQLTAQDIVAMFGPSEEGMLQRHLPHTWPQALDMYLTEYERAHATCRDPCSGLAPLLATLHACAVPSPLTPLFCSSHCGVNSIVARPVPPACSTRPFVAA